MFYADWIAVMEESEESELKDEKGAQPGLT
jgi:hypothetical protein